MLTLEMEGDGRLSVMGRLRIALGCGSTDERVGTLDFLPFSGRFGWHTNLTAAANHFSHRLRSLSAK